MKFNCGPTREERDIALRARVLAYFERIAEWHTWYAWRPVRVASGDCRWLEAVERKAIVVPHYNGFSQRIYAWRYRAVAE